MITPIPEKELPQNNSAVSRLVDINKTHFNNAGVYYYQVKTVFSGRTLPEHFIYELYAPYKHTNDNGDIVTDWFIFGSDDSDEDIASELKSYHEHITMVSGSQKFNNR